MTEFSYNPYKTVEIKELVKHSLENFKEYYVASGIGYLRWCDGVIFSFNTTTESEKAVNDRIAGRVVWGYVAFAKMETFEPTVKKKQGVLELELADVGNDPLFVDFVSWLKKQPIWKDEK